MSIENVLATVAVRDLKTAVEWYENVLGARDRALSHSL
jgi:catechol 2,3-dioxygenase-like lactoylglutathione lyase family enzyme